MKRSNIRTLNDFQNNENESYESNDTNGEKLSTEGSSNGGTTHYQTSKDWKPPVCYHVPNLPLAETAARQMLQRVVREFEPIIKRRNYDVVSVSEMCCCNDGLDFAPTHNGKRRRKIRKVSNNLWGYNSFQMIGTKRFHSEIHLRLRGFRNHNEMLSYEDVAGTMAHELAHCEVSAHNAQFYKVMNSILDEHATLMSSGITKSFESIPSFSGTGYTLGRNDSVTTTNRKTNPGFEAALERQRRLQRTNELGFGSNRLGGDITFSQWMTPTEAAACAAELRRIQHQLRRRGDYFSESEPKNSDKSLSTNKQHLDDLDCFICQPCEDELDTEVDEYPNVSAKSDKEIKSTTTANDDNRENVHENGNCFDQNTSINNDQNRPAVVEFKSNRLKGDTGTSTSTASRKAERNQESSNSESIPHQNKENFENSTKPQVFTDRVVVDLTADDNENENCHMNRTTSSTITNEDYEDYDTQCAILQSTASVASGSAGFKREYTKAMFDTDGGWICSRCTYFNHQQNSTKLNTNNVHRSMLVCKMCLSTNDAF